MASSGRVKSPLLPFLISGDPAPPKVKWICINSTLWDALSGSGVLTMKAKSMYPLSVPQRPQDFKPPTMAAAAQRGDPPVAVNNGPWLTDWSGPPVSANYLAFGYTGEQDGRLVLYGWLYNLAQQDLASAQVIGKLYYGSLDAEGAKKVAREFAADILQQFGAKSLAGSKIWFVSDRNGDKRNLVDGLRRLQPAPIDHYRDISEMPAVSADGKMIAFTRTPRAIRRSWCFRPRPGSNCSFIIRLPP